MENFFLKFSAFSLEYQILILETNKQTYKPRDYFKFTVQNLSLSGITDLQRSGYGIVHPLHSFYVPDLKVILS